MSSLSAGSRQEAQQACSEWADDGPKKVVNEWLYRIRLKDASGSSTWSDYGLDLPKSAPKPGEWSEPIRAPKKSDIPAELPNEEVEAWPEEYTLTERTCVPEIETMQILGMIGDQVEKRFEY